MTKLKGEKASGIGNIEAELIKAAGDRTLTAFCELVSETHNTDDVVGKFKKCILVFIPKKVSLATYEKYRTLSLI